MGGLEFNVCSHQRSSSIVPRGCLRGMKGLLPKISSINCNEVRYVLPSGMANNAWDNRPCNFCTCSRSCAVVRNQSFIAFMYFKRFAVVRQTLPFSRSHVKPMKVGVEEKGVSLESSQGIPS
jgi:hypothetical protein